MRIGYLIPGVGITETERARRTQILSDLSGCGASVQVLTPTEGPSAIESADDEARAVQPLLELAREHEQDHDVYVIGCFGDVGIGELRRIVRIPVVGPARATYSIAAALFREFSVLALNTPFIDEEWELAQQLAVASYVRDVVAVDLHVRAIMDRPDRTLDRLVELSDAVRGRAVVPGCMSLAFLLAERKVDHLADKMIVNPLRCALATARALVW